MYKLYKEMELTGNIRWRRLQRVGHVIRVMGERVPEISLSGYIEGRRPVGRPVGRCLDEVDGDVKRLSKCRNWRISAGDRDVWRRRIEMPEGEGLKRPGGGGLRCLEAKD